MKIRIFLLCILASFSVFAEKPSEEAKQAVYEMFEAQDMPGQMNHIIHVMVENQMTENPGLIKYTFELNKFYQTCSGYEALKESLAEIYLKHFTVEEIREITRFYKSPVGKKMRTVSADILLESNRIANERAEKNVPAFLMELKKKEAEAKHD